MNKRLTLLLLLTMLVCVGLKAQQDSIKVYLRTNVTQESIQLRWVVNSPSAWYFTNKNGVTIERYTLMRNGGVLDIPEKKVLTPVPLKPPVLNDWEKIATKDQYAAIIAQALYGKDFEVSGGKKGIGEIIALSQEQEQRYAMAMYAADQSYPAALFAGWGYEDKTAVKGEEYLYRIIPVSNDHNIIIEIGSSYTGLNKYEELPRPLELDAVFGNASVLITWNFKILLDYYNSYFLERSEDGINFKRLTATPLTNITESERIFYNDSIINNKTYYYRVLGISPFGQEGPVSDTIQGMGINKLIYIPHITHVMPDNNGGVDISWEFNQMGNTDLQSFELQRGSTDKGPFVAVASNISPEMRTVSYEKPSAENYLRIAAIPKTGEPTYSFPYLLQMADSIPPTVPQGLEGRIDSLGHVHLKWIANTDADILGYRIYRGQIQSEELVPLNDIAVRINEYQDSVSLKNLNSKVYYAVTAIDERYNQSQPCQVITLVKPLQVKPSPPYISKCQATDNGIELEWVSAKDDALVSYCIYREEKDMGNSTLIRTLTDVQATSYIDTTTLEGVHYKYTVTAKSLSGIESDKSPAAIAKSNIKKVESSIKKFSGKRTEKGIELKWQHTMIDAKSISIYRKEPAGSFYIWKELSIWDTEILDAKAKRNTVYEYLLVIKDQNGRPINTQIKID